MEGVQNSLQFLPNIQRKTYEKSQIFVWIYSFRYKTVNQKVLKKCKDHFNIAGAIDINYILFIALLVYDKISFC